MVFEVKFANDHDNHFEDTVPVTSKNRIAVHEKMEGESESNQAGNKDDENFANRNGHVQRDENASAKHGDFAQDKGEVHASEEKRPPAKVSRSRVIFLLNRDKIEGSQKQDQNVKKVLPAKVRGNPSSE